jgi:3D-(3,5/4)-trihydroxycyclohexane-1,2-dione acylhydrolase (decyclizing)
LGSAGFGTHYRQQRNGSLLEDAADGSGPAGPAEPLPIDLATNAESLGAHVIRTQTVDELRKALDDARAIDGPVVIHIETDRYTGVPSYEGWWEVPVAEVSDDPRVRAARDEYEKARQAQRHYVESP